MAKLFTYNKYIVLIGAILFCSGLVIARPMVNNVVKVNLLSSTASADQVAIRWDTNATTGFDPRLEATKIFSAGSVNLSFTSGTRAMSILAEPFPTVLTSYPLSVNVPAAGTYRLTFENLTSVTSSTWVISLFDATANTYTPVTDTTTYSFVLSAAGTIATRFSLVVNPAGPLSVAISQSSTAMVVYPSPVVQEATIRFNQPLQRPTSLTLVNQLGQAVLRLPLSEWAEGATLQMSGLPAGVYYVQMAGHKAYKVIKK